jgi:hypothetical protein
MNYIKALAWRQKTWELALVVTPPLYDCGLRFLTCKMRTVIKVAFPKFFQQSMLVNLEE